MKYLSVSAFCLLTLFFLGLATLSQGAQDNALKYKLKPGANGKLCLNCHNDFQEKLKKPVIHTPVKAGECTGCHSPHTSSHGKLLASDPKDICYSCHARLGQATDKSVHRVVAEGQCVKCHDPHSAANKNNLLKAGNELCLDCHKDLAGMLVKIKFRHAPVAKGCLNCHDPHVSAKYGYLLKNDVPALCIGCHKTDRPLFAKQHMNYPVATARCTSCHDPHGSNNPGILFNAVHKPVANKQCNQCHEESGSATPLKTKRPGYELCKGCHNEMVNKTFGKKQMHWPLLSRDGCLTCHNPHAAPKKGLLKDNMIAVCGRCHKDTIKRQEQSLTKHPPIQDGDCMSCHDPHSSDNTFLTSQPSIIELCGTCHDWQKHSTHPIGEKFKDPRDKNITLQCLSCHRSHGTEYKHFIPFATPTELCTQCHEQFKR